MELLFGAVFVCLIVYMVSRNAREGYKAATDANYKYVEPKCPPHKWSYHEVKDQNGNTVMHKLVCAHCGPLKGREDEGRSI